MSIKEVDKIPDDKAKKRQTYRQMIRNDIAEAISKRIPKFELEGDYNYKYLNNYAREEAQRYFASNIYRPLAAKVREYMHGHYDSRWFSVPSEWEVGKLFVQVHKISGEDRPHVFVELDFEFVDNLYDYLLDRTIANFKDYEERKRIRDERKAKG